MIRKNVALKSRSIMSQVLADKQALLDGNTK